MSNPEVIETPKLDKNVDEEMHLEKGSCPMTLQDIYAMFYVLVRQNQKVNPGSKMSFDLNVFKTLPKQPKIYFEQKHGRLFAWIPEKPSDHKKKSRLHLPKPKKVITNNHIIRN